jgi:hypothetical protein
VTDLRNAIKYCLDKLGERDHLGDVAVYGIS